MPDKAQGFMWFRYKNISLEDRGMRYYELGS